MTIAIERVNSLKMINAIIDDVCSKKIKTLKDLRLKLYQVGRHYPANYEIDILVSKDKTKLLKD